MPTCHVMLVQVVWRGTRGFLHSLSPKPVLSPSLRMLSLQSMAMEELRYGETVLAEDNHGCKKLIHLKEGGRHDTRWGSLFHRDIAGRQPGSTFTIHERAEVMVRRPRLEEYVLLFQRGPTPSYTKDIWAMIGMMNISPGSVVVEGGTGSGSLTLYLSQAGKP